MAKKHELRLFLGKGPLFAALLLVGAIAMPAFSQGWQSGDSPKKSDQTNKIITWEERNCDQPRFKNLPACFSYCNKAANAAEEACVLFVLNRKAGS